MILCDVEESHTILELDEETLEEIVKVCRYLEPYPHPQPVKRKIDALFLRGDGVILIAPPVRV